MRAHTKFGIYFNQIYFLKDEFPTFDPSGKIYFWPPKETVAEILFVKMTFVCITNKNTAAMYANWAFVAALLRFKNKLFYFINNFIFTFKLISHSFVDFSV